MATALFLTANTLLPSFLGSSSASPSSSVSKAASTIYASIYPESVKRELALRKAVGEHPNLCSSLTKRSLAIYLTTTFTISLASNGFADANAAILEADDDEELMERVKKDRKKRLERQGIINSSKKETAYLQELINRLSKVSEAIDNNDLNTASSILGSSTAADWVQNANTAFTKLTSSPEEKAEVDTFSSSLASLISSVTRKDVESSKIAFVSSASAFEKWTALTGLAAQLKGL